MSNPILFILDRPAPGSLSVIPSDGMDLIFTSLAKDRIAMHHFRCCSRDALYLSNRWIITVNRDQIFSTIPHLLVWTKTLHSWIKNRIEDSKDTQTETNYVEAYDSLLQEVQKVKTVCKESWVDFHLVLDPGILEIEKLYNLSKIITFLEKVQKNLSKFPADSAKTTSLVQSKLNDSASGS